MTQPLPGKQKTWRFYRVYGNNPTYRTPVKEFTGFRAEMQYQLGCLSRGYRQQHPDAAECRFVAVEMPRKSGNGKE